MFVWENTLLLRGCMRRVFVRSKPRVRVFHLVLKFSMRCISSDLTEPSWTFLVYFQRPYRTKLNISQRQWELNFFLWKASQARNSLEFMHLISLKDAVILWANYWVRCRKSNVQPYWLYWCRTLLTSQQDLTERAIEVFKNIGRARAAKVLGVDLAQFYLWVRNIPIW